MRSSRCSEATRNACSLILGTSVRDTSSIGSSYRDTSARSVVAYVVAIPLTFVHPGIACGLYIAVAIAWLVPDRRIERVVEMHGDRQKRTG